jgi:hypothetical protein
MQIILKEELTNLRVNFHLRLATKRDISIDKEELAHLIHKMNMSDEEVQSNIVKLSSFKRWLRIMKSSFIDRKSL